VPHRENGESEAQFRGGGGDIDLGGRRHYRHALRAFRAVSRKIGTSPDAGERVLGRLSRVRGQAGCPAARRRMMMQPYISQALLGVRVAEMHREAEAAGLARDGKQARRLRRVIARMWS
jgi:hypothetical protein